MGKEPPGVPWPLVLMSTGENPPPENPRERSWVVQGTRPTRQQENPLPSRFL